MAVGNHREAADVRAFGWRLERVGRKVVDGSGVGQRFTLESEALRRACWYGGGASVKPWDLSIIVTRARMRVWR